MPPIGCRGFREYLPFDQFDDFLKVPSEVIRIGIGCPLGLADGIQVELLLLGDSEFFHGRTLLVKLFCWNLTKEIFFSDKELRLLCRISHDIHLTQNAVGMDDCLARPFKVWQEGGEGKPNAVGMIDFLPFSGLRKE